jgi:hypothetical protein
MHALWPQVDSAQGGAATLLSEVPFAEVAGTAMSDHALLAFIMVGGFVIQGAMLAVVALKLQAGLREAQRLTKAVGALVIQETAKLRSEAL